LENADFKAVKIYTVAYWDDPMWSLHQYRG